MTNESTRTAAKAVTGLTDTQITELGGLPGEVRTLNPEAELGHYVHIDGPCDICPPGIIRSDHLVWKADALAAAPAVPEHDYKLKLAAVREFFSKPTPGRSVSLDGVIYTHPLAEPVQPKSDSSKSAFTGTARSTVQGNFNVREQLAGLINAAQQPWHIDQPGPDALNEWALADAILAGFTVQPKGDGR